MCRYFLAYEQLGASPDISAHIIPIKIHISKVAREEVLPFKNSPSSIFSPYIYTIPLFYDRGLFLIYFMRFSNQPTTTTYNGGISYSLSDKHELIKKCLISFLQKDFYESEQDKLKDIQNIVSRIDPDWCMKLAIFSREYGLRTINHIVFVESAKKLYGTKGVRGKLTSYLSKMVRRPDELIDIVGYFALSNWQNFNSIILPNALKEAVKSKLAEFSDYQLAKYKGKWEAINLYDLVNMVHAKGDSINKLMNWTLESADTWEVEISKNGNNKESWNRLLSEKKLGALATVRNLRNMIQAWVDTNKIAEYLDTIKWSDVFPFQAIQALDMLSEASVSDNHINEVIMKHVKECFKYISEKYKGKIAIGVDVSGSMFNTSVSNLSKMDRAKMAVMYGMILKEITDGDLYLWSDRCGMVNSDDYNQIMQAAQSIKGGTYIQTFLESIRGKVYDYALVLTDEQTSDSLENVVKEKTIVWGLHDYKNTIVNGQNTVYFTGYNDIMWKIGSDIFRLGELERNIENIK